MKLLVLGGNGFVGSQICRHAVMRGFDVIGLSRRGRPLPAVAGAKWARKVEWRAGSALDPNLMASVLPEVDGVIHSIGIMFESDLNKYMSGSGATGKGVTYEQENRDTAIVPIRAAAKIERCKSFVFVSAKSAPPGLARYMKAKQEVEAELEKTPEDQLRGVVLRPGVIYHKTKPSSLLLRYPLKLLSGMSDIVYHVGAFAEGIPGAAPPMDLDVLAEAAVEAAVDGKTKGVLEHADMYRLADIAMKHPHARDL